MRQSRVVHLGGVAVHHVAASACRACTAHLGACLAAASGRQLRDRQGEVASPYRPVAAVLDAAAAAVLVAACLAAFLLAECPSAVASGAAPEAACARRRRGDVGQQACRACTAAAGHGSRVAGAGRPDAGRGSAGRRRGVATAAAGPCRPGDGAGSPGAEPGRGRRGGCEPCLPAWRRTSPALAPTANQTNARVLQSKQARLQITWPNNRCLFCYDREHFMNLQSSV